MKNSRISSDYKAFTLMLKVLSQSAEVFKALRPELDLKAGILGKYNNYVILGLYYSL